MSTLNTFVRDLEVAAAAEVNGAAIKLVNGQCADMESYNRLVGHARGCSRMAVIAREMLKKLESDEQGDLPGLDP